MEKRIFVAILFPRTLADGDKKAATLTLHMHLCTPLPLGVIVWLLGEELFTKY